MRRFALVVAWLAIAFVPPAGAAPACDVSGTWSDEYGTLYLRASAGGSVSGNYTWQNGTLSGIMDGVWLNGTWAEEPTFAGPRDAGRFSWQFGEDCSVFTGTYSYAENPEGVAGSWAGTRIAASEGPDETLPKRPACDPTGEWQTNHGRVYLFTQRGAGLADLQGQWMPADVVQTLAGTLSGNRYEGRWSGEDASGHFVMVFDESCDSFQGDWTDESFIHTWNGTRTELAPVVSPAAPTPPEPTTPPTEPPLPTESTEPTPEEHLPGVGEDADDPLGVPGPALALMLAALAGLALAARGRRS